MFTCSPVPDYVKATVDTIIKIHHNETPGDVLAFVTGMVSIILLGDIFHYLSKWI